jgi:hypothetical protein
MGSTFTSQGHFQPAAAAQPFKAFGQSTLGQGELILGRNKYGNFMNIIFPTNYTITSSHPLTVLSDRKGTPTVMVATVCIFSKRPKNKLTVKLTVNKNRTDVSIFSLHQLVNKQVIAQCLT